MTADDLASLFTTPQITTDTDGVHRDAAGCVFVAVDIAGETEFVAEAADPLYRGDWSTECGNDCHGPEGHREGCPIHCYCYDD